MLGRPGRFGFDTGFGVDEHHAACVGCETPLAGPALEVIHWYFREVPRLTAAVGVAEAEKLAAQGEPAR